ELVAKADEIECSVVATANGISTVAKNDTVTVSDSLPVMASVSLSPTTVWQGTNTFTCTPTATDDDGEAISYTYSWKKNGTTYLGNANTNSISVIKGDTVECAAVASSGGSSTGVVSSLQTTVLDTAPVITAVAVTPDPVYVGTHT